MFWPSKQTVSALEAELVLVNRQLSALRADVDRLDPAELTRLRQTVNNALRSLRRLDETPAKAEVPPKPEPVLTMNQARARARGLL